MFKRKVSLKDCYSAAVFLWRSIFKRRKIDPKFSERLMLAVTEVNGCAACSYAHTRMALAQGMPREEVEAFLSASDAYVDPDEASAILFAQHYADSGARPDHEAYQTVVSEYGTKKAADILATIQIIQFGNMYGIPYSALNSRIKGRPYPGSSALWEIGIQLSLPFVLPLSFLHMFFRTITGHKNVKFASAG